MKVFRKNVWIFAVFLFFVSGEVVASKYVKQQQLAQESYKAKTYKAKKIKKQKSINRGQKWINPVITRLQLEAERARRLARPVPIITVPLQAYLVGEKFKKSYQKFSKNFTKSQEYIISSAKFSVKLLFWIAIIGATGAVAVTDVVERFSRALFQEKTFDELYNSPEFAKYRNETLQIVKKAFLRGESFEESLPGITAEEITREYYYMIFTEGMANNEHIIMQLSPSFYHALNLLSGIGFQFGTQLGYVTTLLHDLKVLEFMNFCVGIPIIGVMFYSFMKYKNAIERGVKDISWQEELLNIFNSFNEDFSVYEVFSDQDKLFIQDFIERYRNLDADEAVSIIVAGIRNYETLFAGYSSEQVQKYETNMNVLSNEINYDPSAPSPILENMKNIIRAKDDILKEEYSLLPRNKIRLFEEWIFRPVSESEKLQHDAVREFVSSHLQITVKQHVD